MKRELEAMGNLDHQMIDVKLENIQTGRDCKHQGTQKTCKLYILRKYFVDALLALGSNLPIKDKAQNNLSTDYFKLLFAIFHIPQPFPESLQLGYRNRIINSNSMPPFILLFIPPTRQRVRKKVILKPRILYLLYLVFQCCKNCLIK